MPLESGEKEEFNLENWRNIFSQLFDEYIRLRSDLLTTTGRTPSQHAKRSYTLLAILNTMAEMTALALIETGNSPEIRQYYEYIFEKNSTLIKNEATKIRDYFDRLVAGKQNELNALPELPTLEALSNRHQKELGIRSEVYRHTETGQTRNSAQRAVLEQNDPETIAIILKILEEYIKAPGDIPLKELLGMLHLSTDYGTPKVNPIFGVDGLVNPQKTLEEKRIGQALLKILIERLGREIKSLTEDSQLSRDLIEAFEFIIKDGSQYKAISRGFTQPSPSIHPDSLLRDLRTVLADLKSSIK